MISLDNRKPHVYVTGGTGFVGHWMRMTQPKTIFAAYADKRAYENRGLELRERGDEWNYIVHLAPISPERVLKYAAKNGAKVLFASSGAVYEQKTPYAFNKRLFEAQCRHSEAEVVIARLFTFSGAYLKPIYALPAFIEAAKKGEPLKVWGDGSSVRSYLYGEDLGRWMWKILLEGDGIYDVGGSKPYTILEIARQVADIIPSKIQVMNDRYPVSRYLPNLDRALALGCEETVDLKTAIERTISET